MHSDFTDTIRYGVRFFANLDTCSFLTKTVMAFCSHAISHLQPRERLARVGGVPCILHCHFDVIVLTADNEFTSGQSRVIGILVTRCSAALTMLVHHG